MAKSVANVPPPPGTPVLLLVALGQLLVTGGPAQRNFALRINEKLRARYGLDIKLGTHIGAGLKVSHYVGIVISQRSVIGENLHIKQNVTIGVRSLKQKGGVYIGIMWTLARTVVLLVTIYTLEAM